MLKTDFWRHAAASLPAQVRSRYALELQQAERIDLAVQDAVGAYRRARVAVLNWFHAPTLKPRIDH